MRLLYDLLIQGYRMLILIASAWNQKARHWINGRKGWSERLEEGLKKVQADRVWMHCASVGEFEQGRPILEAIREHYPGTGIVLTFFSPSGYELRKNYAGADLVAYLPLDTPGNAHRFVSLTHPRLAIFIKYEHWYHHLQALKARGIATVLASSIFRPEQPFFKPWGGFWRRMLDRYNIIYVQDKRSARLLEGIGLAGRVHVAGDTRFDRVCTVADSSAPIETLAHLPGSLPVIVAGSTWPEDERLLSAYVQHHPDVRLIIAPHEITSDHLASVERNFPKVIRWSACQTPGTSSDQLTGNEWRTLLIDNVGMLSQLYRYGAVAYVGGGFHRAGIHNILEAAVYGMPVVFGPVHQKAREARDLKELGGAFEVQNTVELEKVMGTLLSDTGALQAAGAASAAYVRGQAGATTEVMKGIQAYLRSRS